MIINYKINKQNYKITFCNNKESPDIYKALSKLYCDKKLLLIIDNRLNKRFTKFLFKDLKKCGLKVTSPPAQPQPIASNPFSLN